ncbi:hypothetical protein Scep_009699 [Stephania cephalantha]|uniref:Uncharacterized protein n=1 Tax=Stephania cephalantha TaxID=152367 RepID=A0AAP0PCR0_9MAGN
MEARRRDGGWEGGEEVGTVERGGEGRGREESGRRKGGETATGAGEARTTANAGGDGGGEGRRSTTLREGRWRPHLARDGNEGGEDAGGTGRGRSDREISVREAMGKKSKRGRGFGWFKVAWKS